MSDVDSTPVGKVAAEVMDLIAAIEVEEGDRVDIQTVAVVVEVNIDSDDGPGWTNVFYRCSDPRRWVQAGFFEQAKRAVMEPTVEEIEPEEEG